MSSTKPSTSFLLLGLFVGPPSSSIHKTMSYLLQRLWQIEDIVAGDIYVKVSPAVWPRLPKCAPWSYTLPGGLWHSFNRDSQRRVSPSKCARCFQTSWEWVVLSIGLLTLCWCCCQSHSSSDPEMRLKRWGVFTSRVVPHTGWRSKKPRMLLLPGVVTILTDPAESVST